jgi:hypothetical protein
MDVRIVCQTRVHYVEKCGSLYVAATGVQPACPLPNAAASRQRFLSLPSSLQIAPSCTPYAGVSSCKSLRFQLVISMQFLTLPFSFIFSSMCATCPVHLTPRPCSLFTLTICHTGLVQPVLQFSLLWHFDIEFLLSNFLNIWLPVLFACSS